MSKEIYDDEPGRHLKPVSAASGQMVQYDPMQARLEDDDTIDLREYWRILLKRRWMVLSVVMIIVVATLLSTILMVPVYRSTAAVQITPPNNQILEYADFSGDQGGYLGQQQFYTTQYEILRSRGLAEAVVRNEGVENHPELTGEIRQRSLIGELKGLPGAIKNALTPNRTAEIGGLSAEQKRERAIRAAAGALRSRIEIEPVRNSNLVKVSVEAFDPGFAAEMANAVVAEYTRSSMQRRFAAGSQARDFLEDQLADMRISIERADQALLDFAQRNKVADLDQRVSMATSTLNDLNQRLSDVETELITLGSYKNMIERGQAADISLVNGSEEIRALRNQRAGMATEYASLSQRFKEDYPTLVELRNQMDEISDQIAEERTLAIRGILSRYNSLSSEAESLREAIETREGGILALNQQAVQYNILKRDFETNRELYDGLLQRMKEIGVAAGVQANNIAIIDSALPPGGPFKPVLSRNLALALVLGLMGGVGLALVLEFFDSSIHRTEDLEALTGRPVLGLVPMVKAKAMREDNSQFSLPERAVGHYSARFPKSSVSEAFRSLRTSLMFSTPEGMPNTILVTSPGPGDGKTTTSINLATVMAQNGSRVLLIDADLRKPRLHRDFGKPQSPGLTNRIAGKQTDANESSSILATDVEGLFLMPSGPSAPNPAELLSSERMRKIVAMNGRAFDHVIIDTAPILGLADSMVLSRLVDGVIVVTQAGKTAKDTIKTSMRRLAQVRAPVLGVVLNAVDLDSPDYAYYSSYYYNYESDEDEDDGGKAIETRVLGGSA
ncbi:MAG: polysaccharide biosynthesis tyrosine autokinase [Wenzhouxiangellaceae bacterium]|nr:polysaccharide biosynthesis tyrosine autokinase [Wenzhouxiangellaceae bacterium]